MAKAAPKPKAGTTKGRNSSPLSLFGGGKNGRASAKEGLSPGQMTTTTPGDPLDRSLGQYGKEGPSYLPDDTGSSAGPPIRNVKGGVRDRPRSGGFEGKFQRSPEVPF